MVLWRGGYSPTDQWSASIQEYCASDIDIESCVLRYAGPYRKVFVGWDDVEVLGISTQHRGKGF